MVDERDWLVRALVTVMMIAYAGLVVWLSDRKRRPKR